MNSPAGVEAAESEERGVSNGLPARAAGGCGGSDRLRHAQASAPRTASADVADRGAGRLLALLRHLRGHRGVESISIAFGRSHRIVVRHGRGSNDDGLQGDDKEMIL